MVTDSPGLTGGLPTVVDRLTQRQFEVLRLVAAGVTNTAIARQLGVSVKTVQAHRANLMTRLGIHNVAGLVRYAIRIGLIRREKAPACRSGLKIAPAARPRSRSVRASNMRLSFMKSMPICFARASERATP